jgi:TonB family protein
MIMFTAYIIKVFICSAVVYVYYTLALKNNSIHHWNRYYLLYGSLLSLVLPLIQISIPPAAAPATRTYATQLIYLRETIINGGAQGQYLSSFSSVWLMLYTTIAALLLTRIIINIFNIRRLVKTSPVDEQTGLILAGKSPFSFFSNIFWPQEIAPDSKEGQQILRHELAHVTGKHTIDKLIMELVCSLCWINPFFHLLKKELSMVHEFIADKAAADEDTASDYARTILMMTLQSKSLPVVNNFSEAPVKRRILMLFNNNSTNTFMKKTIVLPLIAGLVAVISCRQEQAKPAQIETIKMEPVAPDEQVYTFVSDPPKFPGGEEKLSEYIMSNLKYPREAQEHGTSGTVFVQFVVKSDGKISDVKTVGKVKGNGLEEEAIRVVKSMPSWVPGEQEGQKVSVQFNLPIRYTLEQ